VLVVGYDRTNPDPNLQYFIVKNSWGGSDFYKVSYEFMAKASYGGAVIDNVISPAAGTPASAQWLGNWAMDHDGWKGNLVVRRFSSSAGRLGHRYATDGTPSAVNGALSADTSFPSGAALDFYVAPVAEDAPGTYEGQHFQVSSLQNEQQSAAGVTPYNGSTFGVKLNRIGPAASTFTCPHGSYSLTGGVSSASWSHTTPVQNANVAGDGAFSCNYYIYNNVTLSTPAPSGTSCTLSGSTFVCGSQRLWCASTATLTINGGGGFPDQSQTVSLSSSSVSSGQLQCVYRTSSNNRISLVGWMPGRICAASGTTITCDANFSQTATDHQYGGSGFTPATWIGNWTLDNSGTQVSLSFTNQAGGLIQGTAGGQAVSGAVSGHAVLFSYGDQTCGLYGYTHENGLAAGWCHGSDGLQRGAYTIRN
jgi:hypothetical protein